MKPIKFKGENIFLEGDKGKSKSMNARIEKGETSLVISCWRLSFVDVMKIIFTKKIWLVVRTIKGDLHSCLISVNKKDFFKSRNFFERLFNQKYI